MNVRQRIEKLEAADDDGEELQTFFILPDEPTPEHLAELARRGLACFVIPDNGRGPQ